MSSVKRRGRRKRRHLGALYFVLSVLVIAALIIIATSVFFKVSKIEVRGFSRYTVLQIKESAGITEGDNLFFINGNETARNLIEKLPYIDSVRIRHKLPDTVVIEGTECVPVAVAAVSDYYWLIDKKGKILESVSYADAEGYIFISGISVLAPYAGTPIQVSEAEEDKKTGLLLIMDELSKAGILPEVSEINVEKAYDITFKYMERFTVRLGIREDIDYKIFVLNTVIPQLATNERGTIDLSDPKNTSARFIPEQENTTPVLTANDPETGNGENEP